MSGCVDCYNLLYICLFEINGSSENAVLLNKVVLKPFDMRNNIYKFLFLVLLVIPAGLMAQSRYWINGSGDWNNTKHWAEISGGKGGASVPNLKNSVFFDSNSANSSFVVNMPKSAGANSVDVKSGVDLNLNSSTDAVFAYNGSVDSDFSSLFSGELIKSSDFQTVKSSRASSRASTLTITNQKNVTCFNGSNGEFSFTFTSDEATNYRYQWINIDDFSAGSIITTATSHTFTGLTSGDIIFRVKDGDLPSTAPTLAQKMIVMEQPLKLVLAKSDVTSLDPTCFGSATGSIVAVAKGGTQPYSYILNPGNTLNSNGTFNNLLSGTYSVTVNDINGCGPILVDDIQLVEPNPIAVSNVILKHVDCYNAANGAITVTATGGNELEYSIGGAMYQNIGTTFTGLPAGSYIINIRDKNDNSCSLNAGSYTITQPANIVFIETLSNYNGFNISCPGNNDGSINVNGTGGASNNLEYSIGGLYKNVGSAFSALTVGNYTITIRDKDNPTCVKTKSVTLTEPTTILIATTTKNISCFGGSNGEINVNSSQGVAPYSVTLTKTPSTVIGTKAGATVSFTGLTFGSYKVDVVDANGCIQTKNITLTQPVDIQITALVKNLTCYNINSGAIEITVNNGTPNYVLELKHQVNGVVGVETNIAAGAKTNFQSLAPGNYVLTVEDANSCQKIENYSITEPTQIKPTIAVTNVTCFGGNSGKITISANGGTPPYNVMVENAPAAIVKVETGLAVDELRTISGLVAGTYSISVIDANGCTVFDTKTITQPTEIVISNLATNVKCFNGNDGTITVSATGSNPNYTIDLYNASNNIVNSFTNVTSATPVIFYTLIAGDYYAKVTDSNGCEKSSQTISVIQPAQIVVTNAVLQNLTCTGSGNGKISLTINGGTAPYQVQISKGAFNQVKNGVVAIVDFDNLEAGVYNIVIVDAQGCTLNKSYTLTEPDSFNVTPTINNVSCFQGNDGGVDLVITGGTAPYTVELSGTGILKNENNVAKNTLVSFTGLTAQNYNVKITDVNGCETTASYTVTQPTEIIINSLNTIKPLCFSNADGKILFNITGGSPLYAIYLLNTDGSQNSELISKSEGETLEFSAIAAGNYTIKVVDAKMCEKEFPVVVDQPTPIVISVNNVKSVSCFGGNNGTINSQISGGTPLYSVDLLNSAGVTVQFLSNIIDNTAFEFTNLVADTYNLKIVDFNGCQKESADIIVTQPEEIKLVSKVNNLSCFESGNGSVEITITGGTETFTVQLLDNASAEVASFTNVAASEVKLFENLIIGTYSIKITDLQGCELLSPTFDITQPDKIIATAVAQKNVACFGEANGEIIVAVTSGGIAPFQVSLDGGANYIYADGIISNLAFGNYNVVVKDANGCTSETIPVSITQPELLTATFDITNVICKNDNSGTITVNPVGGTAPYEYSIDYKPFVSTNFFDALQANDYIIAVRDANGCIYHEQVFVTEPINGLKIRTVNSKNIFTCNGNLEGEIIFTATSEFAITYYIDGPVSLNNTTGVFENLPAGDYDIYVTDESGCTVMHTKQIAITQPSELVFDYINVTNFLATACSTDKQGKIFVKASGGVGPYQYSIDGVNFTSSREFINLDGGVYQVFVRDANGCITMQEVTIIAPLPIVITNIVAQNPICFNTTDGKITVTAEGGTGTLNYSINGGAVQNNGIFENLAAGDYTITVTDDNNCSFDSQLVVLTSPEEIKINTQVKKYPTGINNDGEVLVTVTGGVNAFIVSLDKTDIPASVIPVPANSSEFLFTNLLAGEYTVHATDANGCGDVTFSFKLDPYTIALTADDVKCFADTNGKISVTVDGGKAPYKYQYFIKPDGTPINTSHVDYPDAFDSLENLPAGEYTITVTEADGNVVTQDITINQPAEITSTPVIIQNDCFGGSVGSIDITISGGTGLYSLTWSSVNLVADVIQNDVAGVSKIENLKAGTYNVAIVDENGCTANFQYEVTEPAKVVVFAEVVSPLSSETASDGEIRTYATGGTGQYIFSLNKVDVDPVATIGGNTVFASDFTFQNLLGKDYQAYAIDENGCVSDATDIILTTFKVEATANKTCFGSNNGAIQLNIMYGQEPFSIEWTNTSATTDKVDNISDRNYTIINLAADVYDLVITDANGTQFKLKVGVASLDEIVILETITKATCYGIADGEIYVTVTGGEPDYIITVTDNVNSNVATIPEAHSGDVNQFQNLAAGDYTISVTDAKGCSNSKVVSVTQPEDLTIVASDIVNPTSESSADGSVKITVAGGTPDYIISLYSIAEDGSETLVQELSGVSLTEVSFSNLAVGQYKAKVADANGCAEKEVVFNLHTIKLDVVMYPVLCDPNSGRLELNITGGVAPFTVVVKLGEAEIANQIIDITGTATIADLSEGNYSISVVDADGNSPEINPTSVTVEKLKYIVPREINKAKCNYHFNNSDIEIGSIMIITDLVTSNFPGNGILTFSWDHLESDSFQNPITALNSGNYTLKINNNLIENCVYTEAIKVEASTNIIVKAGDDRLVCKNDDIIVEYQATVDGNYNKSTVLVEYLFGIEELGKKVFDYSDGNIYSAKPSFTPHEEGLYKIVVSNSECANYDEIKVDFHPQTQLNLLKDSVGVEVPRDYVLVGSSYDFSYNKIVRVNEGVLPTYEWSYISEVESSFSSTTEKEPVMNFVNPQIGVYVLANLTATSDKGCVEKSQFKITFIGSTPPNAISPNDDGVHDSWLIPNAEQYPDIEVSILNRWGQRVFYTKHYQNAAGDDNFKGLSSGGNKLPAGTYYFILDYNREGTKPLKGSITIIR